jgi:YcaO-like protein with predicted kinase domain
MHRIGTYRLRPPAETWADFSRHVDLLGITRIANVTGLDRVGIPVYNAIRPNSRSLSVSQGKGVDHDAARVSALMESVEYWHAEHIDAPLREDSYRGLARLLPVVDITRLPLRAGLDAVSGGRAQTSATATRSLDRPLLWIEGTNLVSDQPIWVPYETVTYNRVGLDHARTTFRVSSNGLASGNSLTEAAIHGLCELIERDALTIWWAPRLPPYRESLVDPASVDDPTCRSLLELADAARVDVHIWDVTSDVPVPVFQVCMLDRDDLPEWRGFGPCWGYGCHPLREIALTRAITEAAQSRVTVITSTRDDSFGQQYEAHHDPAAARAARTLFGRLRPRRRFGEVLDLGAGSLEEILRTLVTRVAPESDNTVVLVDLTKPELGVPVVKLISPGLEFYSHFVGYASGPRAQRAVARDAHD